jgi:RHS repeat-associated protein
MVALNKTYRETLTPDRSAKDSGHRFYSPEISRWLSRDPLLSEDGPRLYSFVGNSPVDYVDLLGLREVTFVFYHDFPEQDLSVVAREEAERAMRECFALCDECGTHTYRFEWIRVCDRNSRMRLGFSGRNILLRDPTRVGMFVERASGGPTGQNTSRWRSYGTPDSVRGRILRRNAASHDRRQTLSYDVAVGQLFVHEAVFHGIGRVWTDEWSAFLDLPVRNLRDYIDSPGLPRMGEIGVNLSPQRCRRICD